MKSRSPTRTPRFPRNCNDLDPSYAPETINTDGWAATQNAFVSLFPTVTTILCFLHGFLKIKDRGRKLHDLHRAVWNVYRETTAEGFISSMKSLVETCRAERWSPLIMQSIEKLAARVEQYAKSYAHPDCLADKQYGRSPDEPTHSITLPRTGGIHGHQHSSELTLRGWALIQNFRETSRLALATLDPFLVPLTVSIRRGITKTGYRTSTYQRLEEVSEED